MSKANGNKLVFNNEFWMIENEIQFNSKSNSIWKKSEQFTVHTHEMKCERREIIWNPNDKIQSMITKITICFLSTWLAENK